jgi:hypothetical protein
VFKDACVHSFRNFCTLKEQSPWFVSNSLSCIGRIWGEVVDGASLLRQEIHLDIKACPEVKGGKGSWEGVLVPFDPPHINGNGQLGDFFPNRRYQIKVACPR